MRPKSLRLLVAVLAAGLVTPALTVAPSQATDRTRSDPAVITHWNTIAARTIFPTVNPTPIPSSSVYFGYVSIAMYDAVVAIEGGYEPYLKQPRVRARASSEAAAATAAYRVLSHYFPTSADRLATDYAQSLAAIPDGSAEERGKRVGDKAAERLIQARLDDGLLADITLNVTPAPGVWRPTPPGFFPMAVPWLGFVDSVRAAFADADPAARPRPDHFESLCARFRRGEGKRSLDRLDPD